MLVAFSFVTVGCLAALGEPVSSDPIRIDSNGDFTNFASSGNGTVWDPWALEDLDIDGAGEGYCIYVGNTTEHFVIKTSVLHDASGNSGDYRWNSGIVFYNVANGKVDNCAVYGSDNGVLLVGSSDVSVEHVSAYSNVNGVHLLGSGGCLVTHCNASSNSNAGILLDDSDGNTLLTNAAFDNGAHGVELSSSCANQISELGIIGNCDSGLYLGESSDYNDVDNAYAALNTVGISMDSSTGNSVDNCTFISNDQCGIFLDSSSGNYIFNNNMVNNTLLQAYDESENSWDYTYSYGGNYWSDYNGTDEYSGPEQNCAGGDGIGDNNHCCGGYVEDRYPLMNRAQTFGLGIWDDPNGFGIWDDPNGLGIWDDPNGFGIWDDPN